jgi:exosortase
VLAGLFVLLFAEIIVRLGFFAYLYADWSHALLVPFFAAYFVHQQRDRLVKAEPRACWPGLVVLLAGIVGYFVALSRGADMFKGYAMIVSLLGLVLFTVGPGVLKVVWFPIVYLVFAVKVSHEVWETIAWNLQLIAAKGATFTLYLMGIDATVTSTTIEMFRGAERIGALNVAEACSGMRMLMTFIALGVAIAYLWERPALARLVMVLLTVPIAVVVNVGRVTLLGVLYQIDPQYSAGDFHIFMGMLMLLPALLLFLATNWVFGYIAGDDDDDRESAVSTKAKPEGAA